jgi:hypothetical protein
MIAQSLEKVLQYRQSNVTGNTWTFLSIMKKETREVRSSYKPRPLERKDPIKKDLWILANHS